MRLGLSAAAGLLLVLVAAVLLARGRGAAPVALPATPVATSVPPLTATREAAPAPTPTATPTSPPSAFDLDATRAVLVTVEPLRIALVPSEAGAGQPTPEPPAAPVLAGGFMDLPFPYDGTATNFGGNSEQFRAAVNRVDLGGRVTSYFDHEYPLFPWVFRGLQFFGSEPPEPPAGNSMLIFDGSRIPEDWYTGHTGFDLAPVPGFRESTPIFAPGDGIVHRVAVFSDGNHFVELRHPIEGVGDFLTIFMHLQADQHWSATDARVGNPISAGERIGTMGNTGKSTGIHLHFEVRFDANRDGVFDRQERVDPFGFVALENDLLDPWSAETVLVDAQGQELPHAGVPSRYLWRHALAVTAQVGPDPVKVEAPGSGQGGGETDGSLALVAPANTFPEGSTLLLGWASDPRPSPLLRGTGNGVLVAVFDSQGQPITRFGAPVTLSVRYGANSIQDIDPATVAFYRLDARTGDREPLPTGLDPARGIATASLERPGKYALLGRPIRDLLGPRTTIRLEGPLAGDAGTTTAYTGDVTIRMAAVDVGNSGAGEIQYTLDYGTTWQRYTGPFTVSASDAPAPEVGDGATGEGDSLSGGEGSIVIMVRAVDAAGNEEHPPTVASFAIVPPTTATPVTGTPAARTATLAVTRTPTASRTPAPAQPAAATATQPVEPSPTPAAQATTAAPAILTGTPPPTTTATLPPPSATPVPLTATSPPPTATVAPPTSEPAPTAYP